MVAGGGAAEGSWGQRRPRLSPGPAGGQDLAPPRLEGPRRGWTTAPREGRGLLQAWRGPCAQDGASPRLAQRRLLSPRPAVCSGPSEGHEDSLSSRERALRIPALRIPWPCLRPAGPGAPRPLGPLPGPAGHTLGRAWCSQHRCRNRPGPDTGQEGGAQFLPHPTPWARGERGRGAPEASGASSLRPDSALRPPSCWAWAEQHPRPGPAWAWRGSGRGPGVP